jgi:hypothetical protein
MANNPTDTAIRSRIDSFLTELGALVRKSALEAVREALGGGGVVRAAPHAEASASAARPKTWPRSARVSSLRSVRRQVSGWKKSDVR